MAEKLTLQINTKVDNRSLDGFANRLKGLSLGFSKLGAAVAGFLTVATARKIADVTQQYENQRLQVRQLVGDSEKAVLVLGKIGEVAKRTAADSGMLADAYISMRNAGIDIGVEGMESLAGMAAFAGTSVDRLAETLSAANTAGRGAGRLSQMFGIEGLQGSFRSEDGITGLFQGVEIHARNAQEFMLEIQRVAGDDFARANAESADSFAAMSARMKDFRDNALVAAGTSFLDAFGGVDGLTDSLEKLTPVFTIIGESAAILLDTVVSIAGWLGRVESRLGLFDKIGSKSKTLSKIVAGLVALFALFGPVTSIMGTVLSIVGFITKAVGVLGAVLTPIINLIGVGMALASSVGLGPVLAVIGAIVGVALTLYTVLHDVWKLLTGKPEETYFARLVGMVKAAGETIKQWWLTLVGFMHDVWAGFIDGIKWLFMAYVKNLLDGIGSIVGVIDKAAAVLGKDLNLQGAINDFTAMNIGNNPASVGSGKTDISNSVGRLNVTIEGSTNMDGRQVGDAVNKGVRSGLDSATDDLRFNYAGT